MSLLLKDHIEDSELVECKRTILRVVTMEHHNESLSIPASGIRGKGAKRSVWYQLCFFFDTHFLLNQNLELLALQLYLEIHQLAELYFGSLLGMLEIMDSVHDVVVFSSEETYRQMWAELERLIRAHSTTSPSHQKVLECLLECKRPSAAGGGGSEPEKSRAATVVTSDSDQTDNETDR